MNRKTIFSQALAISTLLVGVLVLACNKKFDEPPTFEEPNVNVNCSIRALKSRHVRDNFELITGDTIISGIVVADDKSGNFYKSIVIQDGTGGITVRLDGTGLFNNYPVGRRIYIKCKGLYLGDYGGLIQIGGAIDVSDPTRPSLDPIASSLFDKYVLKGGLGNVVEPRTVTFSQLTTNLQDSFQSTLIKIVQCEFGVGDTAKTYGDPTLATSALNFTIRSCANTGSIVLRNSSYSNYAGLSVPNGNGDLVGVFNIFGSTRQIQIRDTSDVKFSGARCGSGPATLMNTSTLRGLFTGSPRSIANGTKITGVVISDRSTGNLVDQNLVLQQGNNLSGIVVRFATAHTLNLGDSIDVNVSNESLEEFSGVLQVNGVDTAQVTRFAVNRSITPRTTTLAALATNGETWESTLVSVPNVTLTPAGAWSANSGNTTVTDATGTVTAFTRTAASFSSVTKPAVQISFLNGIVSQFNNLRQLTLRNLTDVGTATGGGTTPPPTGTGINLTTSPTVIDFNGIDAGLPAGVAVRTAATSTAAGTAATFATAKVAWNNVSGAFKNFASATGLTATADQAAQDASTNRALGIRQTGSFGDPGAAFVFQLSNTTGRSNIAMSFKLQSLDASSARTTTWQVDYAVGDNPTTFTSATATGTLAVGNSSFSNNTITVNLPAAVANQSQPVWIRILTTTASTGAGSRASTAVDDVTFTW